MNSDTEKVTVPIKWDPKDSITTWGIASVNWKKANNFFRKLWWTTVYPKAIYLRFDWISDHLNRRLQMAKLIASFESDILIPFDSVTVARLTTVKQSKSRRLYMKVAGSKLLSAGQLIRSTALCGLTCTSNRLCGVRVFFRSRTWKNREYKVRSSCLQFTSKWESRATFFAVHENEAVGILIHMTDHWVCSCSLAPLGIFDRKNTKPNEVNHLQPCAHCFVSLTRYILCLENQACPRPHWHAFSVLFPHETDCTVKFIGMLGNDAKMFTQFWSKPLSDNVSASQDSLSLWM